MWAVIKKRWRGWLRAIHRDFGYVAVGFTLIYALSGLAINHIKDWDPNFTSSERTVTIAPVADSLSDDEAAKLVAAAAGTGTPDDVYRAGDEVRLSYSDGTQVTAVGDTVTVQARSPRFFLRVANWLHYNRGKKAWTYVADVYAVMLLYLAISGIFMIKGKLGLRWRGAVLISAGIAVPLGYVLISGGPGAKSGDKVAAEIPKSAGPTLKPLPPDDEVPAAPKPRCPDGTSVFDHAHGCAPDAPVAPATTHDGDKCADGSSPLDHAHGCPRVVPGQGGPDPEEKAPPPSAPSPSAMRCADGSSPLDHVHGCPMAVPGVGVPDPDAKPAKVEKCADGSSPLDHAHGCPHR